MGSYLGPHPRPPHPPRKVPPPKEREIGMEVFFTSTPGVGGRIKVYPEDFVVEEIPRLPPPGDGKYVIARVESRGWETNALLKKFSAALSIPVGAIGFAGMKDKRAVTRQIMSFPCSIENVSGMNIRNVRVEVMYRSYSPIFRGNLEGNRFEVVVRDIADDIESVRKTAEEIENAGGFPNFFGVQRFGVVRPITHLVGKHILRGDMKKAVMTYIGNPIKGEDEEDYRARKFIEESMDFEEGLKIYPRRLVFERQMIEHLSKKKEDWQGALKKLPRNLSVMFVHAYQSYIFNRVLSMRLKMGIPVNEAIEGDIVITFENGDVQSRKGIKVKKSNIEKINRQIRKGNCFPSGIIAGYDSNFADGKMGEIERKVMEEEGINPEDFLVHDIPFLSSKGMRRIIISPLKRINWSMEKGMLKLSFSLSKGCYATSLLREFMKGDIKNY